MKIPVTLAALSLVTSLHSAEVPKIFAGYFQQDVPVRAQLGVVMPPEEINKYIAKVQEAARKDTKWFKEFSATNKQAVPLPYDERLGLTKAEYDDYLELWKKREFKPVQDIMINLRQSPGDTWSLTATGDASSFSTLRYSPKDDCFISPNGKMNRLEDIKADSSSILGEWSGMEWKFEEETGLGKTKENFAIGRFANNKFALIVYRALELSTEGTKLLEKSLVVRFPLGKAPASTVKDTKPAPKPAPKPTPKKK